MWVKVDRLETPDVQCFTRQKPRKLLEYIYNTYILTVILIVQLILGDFIYEECQILSMRDEDSEKQVFIHLFHLCGEARVEIDLCLTISIWSLHDCVSFEVEDESLNVTIHKP